VEHPRPVIAVVQDVIAGSWQPRREQFAASQNRSSVRELLGSGRVGGRRDS
jgi:hypothetical protein